MTENDLPDIAVLLDLDLPAECLPGVRDALDALAGHWRNVRAFVTPDATPE